MAFWALIAGAAATSAASWFLALRAGRASGTDPFIMADAGFCSSVFGCLALILAFVAGGM